MSSYSSEPSTQIGAGNDMNMISSYGGSNENQQSSTTQGCSFSSNTMLSDQINTNSETGLKLNQDKN
ncbi:hypothetical protein I4U23_027847 [Adineta vaga]|nr:hypothetical protein I4U23_027847 [Adineta vaga]